jgi:ATP-dependent helicase HrpB
MAKDMRAQYPKHDWPDDPANARAHQGLTKKRLQ